MKIILAPDKFRGSLEASEVCAAMYDGIHDAFPQAEVMTFPLADGGEGTMDILTENAKGSFSEVVVFDPLGRNIKARYGQSESGDVAFIEMAEASGLRLLNPDEYNPLFASSFGTGQLIAHALTSGVQEIILGIGGSATNDGGIGMAAALGYQFLDKYGSVLTPNGEALSQIFAIDASNVNPRLKDCQITVACDVTNPLFGKNGAAYIYGPQKGADSKTIEILDAGLQSFARIATHTFGHDVSFLPGAGAAGGVGAGSMWFLNARLESGVQIVMKHIGIEKQIAEADLVITGEGKLDQQTLQGKVILGLSEICHKENTPLAVLCGTLAISTAQIQQAGFAYVASVLNRPVTLETAQVEAFQDVKNATFNMVRLFFYR
jgi:glycerate kinase